MKKYILKVLKLAGLGLMAVGLTAVMIPHECSREDALLLEKFKYITSQEGYQKPQKGELTFYQTNGPVAGGSVSAIFSDQESVYAGIFGDGVYRKRVGDDLWEPLSKGIKDPFVLSLNKTKEGVFLAGTIKGGIFRSEDKGKRWEASNKGLTNLEVTIITEFKNEIFIGTGSGVFKSRDQGFTWEPLNKGMESMLVRAFLIDHSGAIFAGTGGQGIFKSVDKGKKWEHVEFKLQGDSGLNENYIRVMAQSPRKFLFAGTFGGGIFRSTDGGRKWLAVNSGLTNTSIRTLQFTQDGTLITGTGDGIFASSNEGENWKPVNGDLADKNVQSMLVVADQIYIGTASAVFRKNLNDPHWVSLDKGITFPVVLSLTGDPEKGFYAATDGEGVYRSKDGGLSWFPMNEGLADMTIRSIMEDETHTLYILTGEGVYKGDRVKKSWVPMTEGIGQKGIHSLFLDPGNNLFSGTENGLFKWDISSNYWEKMNLPVEAPVKWIAGDQERLYALSDHELFLIKKGESNAFPIPFPQHQGEFQGAFLGKNLYIWTGSRIYEGKELNHDIRWRELPALPSGVNLQTVYSLSHKGKEILLAGTDKGGFLSDDSGVKWRKVLGKGATADVRSFFSPFPGGFLMGTGDRGVLAGMGL
jgi:photosystem II stability/assembly factor-like uncharacterized protein